MVPQQDRAEATRRRIIGAAVGLFGERGFGMVDMVDVIGLAGVSKGACYYHFPTKQSLAEAIIEESNARIAAAFAPLWESSAPAMHRIIMATFMFLKLVDSDDTVRIGYGLRHVVKQQRREPGTRYPGDTDVLFADRLKKAIAEGHVRPDVDPEQTAYTLFTSLVGCQLLAEPFGHDPVKRFTEVWDFVLPAIATDEHLPALRKLVRSESRRQAVWPSA